MAEAIQPNRSLFLGGVFTLLLLGDVMLVTAGAVTANSDHTFALLPPDTSPAIRLLVFFLGLGLSWWFGRFVLLNLVNSRVPFDTSANVAFTMVFFLLFTFAGLAFLGMLSWVLLAVLLAVLFLVVIAALWSLLGAMWVLGAIVLASVGAWLVFYLLG
jgi:hypothetical protein